MKNLLRFILLGMFASLLLSGGVAHSQSQYTILNFAYQDSSTITDGSVTGGDLVNPLRYTGDWYVTGDTELSAAPTVATITAWIDSTNVAADGLGNANFQENSISTLEIRDATIDSTDVAAAGLSGSDLVNPLRVPTYQLFIQSVDADTLFTDLLQMTNNTWIRWVSNDGAGFINGLRVNNSDTIDLGAALNTDHMTGPSDGGLITRMDMPVSDAPADGTVEGYMDKLDTVNLFGIWGRADSAGGVDQTVVESHADVFKMKLQTPMPDTTGFTGGEMWLSAVGDSIYVYKSDNTINFIALVAP